MKTFLPIRYFEILLVKFKEKVNNKSNKEDKVNNSRKTYLEEIYSLPEKDLSCVWGQFKL